MRDTIGIEICDRTGKPIAIGAPVALGDYSLTVDATGADNTLDALLVAAGAPAGTLAALIAGGLSFILATVETQNVRVSFFDADPSAAGLLYGKDNSQPYVWDPADFTKVKLAGQGGASTVRVSLFR